MKGDFSRTTQDRSIEFSGVRMQQGRVLLDADFNEAVEIAARRDRVTTRDVIGPCGVPDVGGGFAIGARARLNALDVADATAFAVGAAGTILRSVDRGATWTVQPVPAGFDDDLLGVDFAVSEQAAREVVPQAAIAVGSGPSVLYTSDGGTSWKPGTLPAGTSGALRGVSFCDAKLGWAVGDDGLVITSRDAGATWTRQAVPPEAVETLHAVHFADDQTGWAVGDGGRLLATTNGGTSWQVQVAPSLGASLRGVRFATRKDGFAVGEGAMVVVTDDGGATWVDRPLAGESATLRGVDVEDPKTATVVGAGPLMRRTTDGGESWTPLTAPAGAGDLSAVRTPGPGILVAGDLDTLGRSGVVAPPAWQPVAIPAHAAADLAISPGRIYVDGELYENPRWTRYGEQSDLPLAPMPTAAGRYIAYLDGWERHLTALERPELREVALGGPDTTKIGRAHV